jgi:hypothetical protein
MADEKLQQGKGTDASRRRFLGVSAGTAAGLAAGAGVVALTRPSIPLDRVLDLPARWDREVDVVIVGGGGSGVCAALSAQEAGAKVIVVENAPHIGGLSGMAVGSVQATGSRLQKEAGIEDDPEWFVEDIIKLAGASGPSKNLDLMRMAANSSGPALDWLVDMGVELRGPFEHPGHRVNRMHVLYPSTAAWPMVLGPLMETRGVEIHLETEGTKVYQTAQGRVVGIQARNTRSGEPINILAKRAVVLAGGDFTGSKEWRQKFLADPVSLSAEAVHPYNNGSKLLMAMAAGADMAGYTASAAPFFRTFSGNSSIGPAGRQAWEPFDMYDAGAILVNTDGRRFTSEQSSDRDLARATLTQPGAVSFIVFDKRVADLFSNWPMVVSSLPGIAEKSGIGGWGVVDDFVARNDIQVANSIDEVVAKISGRSNVQIAASGLKETIAAWNGYAAAGHDPEFGRSTFGVEDTRGAGIGAPPFYIHGPASALACFTAFSVVVDTELRVYDAFGKAIPGLYAAGLIGSNNGIGGGHGTNLGWAITSGRVAGRNAARSRA